MTSICIIRLFVKTHFIQMNEKKEKKAPNSLEVANVIVFIKSSCGHRWLNEWRLKINFQHNNEVKKNFFCIWYAKVWLYANKSERRWFFTMKMTDWPLQQQLFVDETITQHIWIIYWKVNAMLCAHLSLCYRHLYIHIQQPLYTFGFGTFKTIPLHKTTATTTKYSPFFQLNWNFALERWHIRTKRKHSLQCLFQTIALTQSTLKA